MGHYPLIAGVILFAVGTEELLAHPEAALDAGADVAVLGKASIGNPDWPVRSLDPEWAPARPPWTVEHLRSVDVGPDLIAYLMPRAGMVVGGAAARG